MQHNKTFKRFLFLPFIIFLLISWSLPQQAHGQFWKRWFGGHKKEKKKESKKTEKRKEQKAYAPFKQGKSKKDSIEEEKGVRLIPAFPPTVKKKRYRVDIILPFEINKNIVDSQQFLNRNNGLVRPAIRFYEGMRMAAQKLDKQYIHLDLYIHDVGSSGSKIKLLIQSHDLKNSDLIIGFLTSKHLEPFAHVAKKNKINFISALSPSDAGIQENPYFIALQPGLQQHINQLANYIKSNYNDAPPLLLFDTSTLIQKTAKTYIENAFEGSNLEELPLIDFLRNHENLMDVLLKSKTNIIFLNIFSPQKAAQVLTQLDSLPPFYHLTIFGLPTWKYISYQVNADTFKHLNIYYSRPFHFDTASLRGRHLSKAYKKEFKVNPTDMVFRGYETLYWMGHLLTRFGTIFNLNLKNTRKAPFTRFQVIPLWSPNNDFKYFRNTHLYINRDFHGQTSVVSETTEQN